MNWEPFKAAMKDRRLIITAAISLVLGYVAGCEQNRNRWEFYRQYAEYGESWTKSLNLRFDRATGKLYFLYQKDRTWVPMQN